MKFYYVALTINKEQPVRTLGGKRLAYYLKKYEAVNQCSLLNREWQKKNENWGHKDKILPSFIYKVYYVESEPMEVTSD